MKYDDLLDLPVPTTYGNRIRMTRANRAAQFAPFAALTGFDELLAEERDDALEDLDFHTSFNIDLDDDFELD